MSPAVSTSYWSIFERNLVGLVDFAGSKFQRMANDQLAQFRFYRNRVNCTKQAACFVPGIIRPVSIFWLDQLAIRRNSSLQNRPIPLDSSRKLTSSSLREQGTFFNVPSVEKSCFVFWDDNCRPGHKSSQEKFQTLKKKRKNIIPRQVLGHDRPENNSAKCLNRSGEIPSPWQTSIDKTNDCVMISERSALGRGSDPPSGHSVYKTADDTWRAPARRLIQTSLDAAV